MKLLHSSVFPILFCNTSTVSDLTLRSLIHFELILVQSERLGSSFNLLEVGIQFFQHHLLKRLAFLQHMFWAPLLKIKWLWLCEFVIGSPILFYSVGLHVVFVPIECSTV
jgi:hypothetical protein